MRPEFPPPFPPGLIRTFATIGLVAYLRLIDVREAVGLLQEEYEAAVARAGRVFNIVKAMSLRPAVLRHSMALYREIMFGPSGLTRMERELLAVVVSRTNDCHY
jgi:alkylhydroperoxidase family enzyme